MHMVRHRPTVTRNIVRRRYTNITQVVLTRLILNPGQSDASVDAAYVLFLWPPASLPVLVIWQP